MHISPAVNPWYREPWPWLLMAGPALVVVAGFVTLALALSAHDGLVVDDYYKQGKEVNRSLKRDVSARALGLSAELAIDERNDSVRVALVARDPATIASTPRLRLTLAHATVSGRDQVLIMSKTDNNYRAGIRPLAPGKWHLLIEDDARTWRLSSTLTVGSGPLGNVHLQPPQD